MKQLFATMILAVALAGITGCQRIERPVQAAAVIATPTPGATKPVYTCAGKTKAGEACKRHVKAKGDYCWMHQGQAK